MPFSDYLDMATVWTLIKTVVAVVVAILLTKLVVGFVEKRLMRHARTKKHKSNVEIFARVTKYVVYAVILVMAIFSYTGGWTGLGLSMGLFSAALGWALQKPITGLAGWIMIILKRPFNYGDRVIIGNVKGDVVDITPTHIYLSEIGGLVAAEEKSGRIILVPNSILFEQNIINYTMKDEYILDQVVLTITYHSDLKQAKRIVMAAARKYVGDIAEKLKQPPYVRTWFQPSGINVHIRYFTPTSRVQEISSMITEEIFRQIQKSKNVEIAYPHQEIIVSKKR